ncbi:MAG: mechanosensitive ion channel family protein [Halodesulfurarchaeum sp.]|nr:mechanosensitive ion channel family protein [Halodesulfurarchaeum sp.]
MALGFGSNVLELLRNAGSIEMRIELTVAVVLLSVFAIWIVVPRLIALLRWVLKRVMALVGLEPILDVVRIKESGWGFGHAIVRFVQFGLAIVASFVLLAIWGEIDPVLTYLGDLSIPLSLFLKAFVTLLLLVGAYSGMGVLHGWVAEITKRSDKISPHQEEIWLRVLQIIFLIAATIVALSLWGVDLGGLIVGAGFIGIVAGLAAQQTLGALIAGFVLMLSRPFEIGDWVQIGENEGIVTEITIVNTRMENFDGELIALPNDLVGNSTIINRTMKGRLRLRVEVGIDYEADPEHASEVAEAALLDVERVLSVPRPRVVTSRFDDSAIVLELRFWIDKPSARRRALATSESIKAVSAAFVEEDIKIPFPQRELTGRAETGGFRVVDDGSSTE